MNIVSHILLLFYISFISCGPLFFRGRPLNKHGMLGIPVTHPQSYDSSQLPKEQWFDQKLNHFDPVDTRTWKQVFTE